MPSVWNLWRLCLLLMLWVPTSASLLTGCIKVNPCKCIMQDGSGVINLAAMGDADGFLERDAPLTGSGKESDPEGSLSFSPCLPFSEPAGLAFECLEVAVCVVVRPRAPNGETVDFLNFGRHGNNVFSYDNDSRSLTVTYPASHSSPLHTVVRFNCSSNHSVVLSRTAENPNLLQIDVDDPCACPNSCEPQDVGPRTIILIMFGITVTFYFLFGLCALSPVRTPNGVEIIPKENIWCSLYYACVERKRRKQWDPRRYN
ncbi:uncharacterized protein LOC122564967 [Chiloscyllium plagiosum]|uniref:uncharacterized protein LOC122564967 n=1 Tax=Chiloscyllium plagiosum TaxID=36176 RepID=UPI001CB818D9|nr:uncharacterized protein LOC122564967 [Chiloscyllium plagiosum]XP_043576464.1 uncharacterized protein LOC122564967 [Chiloscyllium plagiosum]